MARVNTKIGYEVCRLAYIRSCNCTKELELSTYNLSRVTANNVIEQLNSEYRLYNGDKFKVVIKYREACSNGTHGDWQYRRVVQSKKGYRLEKFTFKGTRKVDYWEHSALQYLNTGNKVGILIWES